MSTAIMAPKRKAKPKSTRRQVAVNLKGNDDWKEWLQRASDHCRMSVSALVDVAVTRYVKAQGFDEPPPKR
jgi:hypothetical protein